jgi:hypothetical protein
MSFPELETEGEVIHGERDGPPKLRIRRCVGSDVIAADSHGLFGSMAAVGFASVP